MPAPSTLFLFSLAALALLVVPGPAVLYILTRSIDQGRAAGLASVLGVHVGTFVHVAAAALGLSALLASSALAYGAVKYLGAAYLIYLGVTKLIAARRMGTASEGIAPAATARPPAQRLGRVFVDGVVVNVLNPKTALFFLAFLPQFVDPARGPIQAQVLFLGGVFVALGLISDGTYALVGAGAGAWLRRQLGFARAERYVSGGVYLALGATAAFAGPRASK